MRLRRQPEDSQPTEPHSGSRSARAGGKWIVLVASVALSAIGVRHVMLTGRSAGAPDIIDNWSDVADLLEHERSEPQARLEPGAVWMPLPREVVTRLHPSIDRRFHAFDPVRGVTRPAGIDIFRKFREHPERGWRIRTNSLGLREDVEVLENPELRVLVAGDSQTEGVCANHESFPNRLEAALLEDRPGAAIEVLNAGLGGQDPYFYIATFEAYRSLQPDVFVAVFYGGNDFSGVLPVERYFHRRGAPTNPDHRKALADIIAEEDTIWMMAELSQLRYFRSNPEDVPIAMATCCQIALDIRRRCRESGTAFLCVYIPPPLTGQPELYAEKRRAFAELLGEEEDWCELSDRLADDWIARLAGEGLPVIDLRPAFRSAPEPLYWKSDPHLDLEGNQVVAAALLEAVRSAGL